MDTIFNWIIKIVLLVFLYCILGLLDIVPLYHCGVAMGPNGPVHFCEWYRGPDKVY